MSAANRIEQMNIQWEKIHMFTYEWSIYELFDTETDSEKYTWIYRQKSPKKKLFSSDDVDRIVMSHLFISTPTEHVE